MKAVELLIDNPMLGAAVQPLVELLTVTEDMCSDQEVLSYKKVNDAVRHACSLWQPEQIILCHQIKMPCISMFSRLISKLPSTSTA